jgi:co-chaperonin GroES (HSP10)
MKPIGKNILCKKLEQVERQGFIILPTKLDFNEFEILSLGNKVNEKVLVGDKIKVPSHTEGTIIDYEGVKYYMFSEDEVSLFD